MTTRLIALRYPATCHRCAADLPSGTRALWDRASRRVTCESCEQREADQRPEHVAGGSAQRIADRRRARHEQRLDNSRFPRLARALDRVTPEAQSTRAWADGAAGERHLGRGLDRLADSGVLVLHDRRIPRRRTNIDHLAVTPNGVWVIDAKNYNGTVERRDKGGWFTVDERLYVAGRDRTKLVDSVHRQVTAVRDALGGTDVPVRGVLCFVWSEWTLLARPFEIERVLVIWPRSLYKRLTAAGPLDLPQRQRLHERLAGALPPA